MKKILLFLIAFVAISFAAFSQPAVGDYRSAANGNWTTLATWERCSSVSPEVWATPTAGEGYPGENSGSSGATVTILGDDQVTVNASIPFAIASLIVGDGAGTRESLTFDGSASFVLAVTGDASFNSGDLIVIDQTNTNLHEFRVGGNFNVSTGSVFTTNAVDDEINVVMNGGGAQSIGGTIAAINLYHLTIDKSAGEVSLTGDVNVNGLLTLTNGLVNTSSTNLLTIGTAGFVAGTSDLSFIDGPIAKNGTSGFVFPVGDEASGYHPIATTGFSLPVSLFQAEYIRASANSVGPISSTGTLKNISHCEYWTLLRTGTANPGVQVSWNANSPCNSSAYVTQTAGLTVAYFDDINMEWVEAAATTTTVNGNTTAGNVTRGPAVTLFGTFALGNTADFGSPLPVKFTSIKAYEKNGGAQIDWLTYNEVNVNHYKVERSANGADFSVIGQVAAFNRLDRNTYGLFDPNPLPGTSFYRVKSFDEDGKASISPVVKMGGIGHGGALTVFPNPVKDGRISLQSAALLQGDYDLRVYNSVGQQVYVEKISHPGGNFNQGFQLPASMKPGMYSIQLRSGEFSLSRAFVVQ